MFRENIGDLFHVMLIFHDCSFGPKYPGTVHTHYSDLLTLPDNVRKRIVLMHYTQVPDGIDPVADGFADAAPRHGRYCVENAETWVRSDGGAGQVVISANQGRVSPQS